MSVIHNKGGAEPSTIEINGTTYLLTTIGDQSTVILPSGETAGLVSVANRPIQAAIDTLAITRTLDMLSANSDIAVADLEGYQLCYFKIFQTGGDKTGTIAFHLDLSQGGSSTAYSNQQCTGKLGAVSTSNTPYDTVESVDWKHVQSGRLMKLAGSKLWLRVSAVDSNVAASPTVTAKVYLFFKRAG